MTAVSEGCTPLVGAAAGFRVGASPAPTVCLVDLKRHGRHRAEGSGTREACRWRSSCVKRVEEGKAESLDRLCRRAVSMHVHKAPEDAADSNAPNEQTP